jgi:hypothetical protein
MTKDVKRKARRIAPDDPGRKYNRSTQNGYGFEMPPEPQSVDIYFDQKGHTEQAALFYEYYSNVCWRSPGGVPYRNWKTLATDWIYEYEQALKLQKRIAARNSVFSGL